METLKQYLKKITDLQYLITVLNWELRIISPTNSKDYLINKISKLEKELFIIETSEEFKNVLNNVINSEEFKNLSEEEQNYINHIYEKITINKSIPPEIANECSNYYRKSTQVWTEAKKLDDYSMFKPYLEHVIELNRKYYSIFKEINHYMIVC